MDGQLFSFGSNSYGQLGLGDFSAKGIPTPVKMPIGVKTVMIAAGSHHSLALTDQGELYSWGAHLVIELAFMSLIAIILSVEVQSEVYYDQSKAAHQYYLTCCIRLETKSCRISYRKCMVKYDRT